MIEFTLDEDKPKAAVEEAHPWIMLFDAVVFSFAFIYSSYAEKRQPASAIAMNRHIF